MNVLSLFNGISCGRIALERAGVTIDNYFSSKDPGKAYFRLMSGPYENKSAVNNAREILIKSGRSPLIRQRCSKN